MNRDEQIGRMILESSTGMHGDIARDLAQAWCNLAEKKQEMQSRLESLEKDAARYRYLRDICFFISGGRDGYGPDHPMIKFNFDIWAEKRATHNRDGLDSAIDEAMQSANKGE